ncbi:MAG: ribonuclease [Candidatus Sumerlaeota bacterium]|nr:ribonuclease [Candidatus Sumerlaeota bacterium]
MAGIDEAGRGPIAGPVVAAAVVWDLDGRRPTGLADSKLLSARTRERLFGQIQRRALSWGIGVCTAGEIDLHNILEATRLAAGRAFEQLVARLPPGAAVGALLTDALDLPAIPLPIMAIPRADQQSSAAAAASILAKVARDRMMDVYHEEFPEYGWNENRGYPTAAHRAAVERFGPTTLHRHTFAGVGFFCAEPRHSLTYQRLVRLLEATPPTRDGLAALGDQVRAAADRLPPPEMDALRQRLGETAQAHGIEVSF